MSGEVLCVVDMQPMFSASSKASTQRACIREIKRAIRAKDVILFVEYFDYNPTLPLLTDIVKNAGYKRSYRVIKNSDDGSREIAAFLRQKRLPRSRFRVCGVNTAYCVMSTVSGLQRKFVYGQIQVVADACNAEDNTHKYGLNVMNQMKNVKLLRHRKNN